VPQQFGRQLDHVTIDGEFLVLPVRIELTTSLLPRECLGTAIRREVAVKLGPKFGPKRYNT
jgi:hypothetical protein